MKAMYTRTMLVLALAASVWACKKDEETTPQTPADPKTQLPAALAGTTVNMEFTTANAGAPFQKGDQVLFTFSANGEMAIDKDPAANNGNEITALNPTTVGSEIIWTVSSTGNKYALSFKSDSSVNEVNIMSSANAFLGQFTPIQSGGGSPELDIIKGMAGTYNVKTVDKGTHSRMTVIIDASGNIDFDTGVSFSTADYNLITDRLDVLDGIWIDMKPYPTEPYPRLELFVKTGTKNLDRMVYRSSYPGSGGNTVEVSF